VKYPSFVMSPFSLRGKRGVASLPASARGASNERETERFSFFLFYSPPRRLGLPQNSPLSHFSLSLSLSLSLSFEFFFPPNLAMILELCVYEVLLLGE